MILTRSIRRKLAIVLALVFAMVVLLSVAGLSVLYGHWSLLDKMKNYRDHEPRRESLVSAIARLHEPLIHPPLNDVGANPFEQSNGELEVFIDDELWSKQRSVVDAELKEFYSRLDGRSAAQANNLYLLKTGKLGLIEKRLKLLDTRREQIKDIWDRQRSAVVEDTKELFASVDRQATTAAGDLDRLKESKLDLTDARDQQVKDAEQVRRLLDNMVRDVGHLQMLVHQIPTSDTILDVALRDSPNAIEWRLWLIGVPSTIVVLLFFSLTYFGYHWILIPIRQLHEAASRVANGDYSYRLKLKGKDEMAELGQMFNKMTERFQTDKAKLDQEVEVRSRQILRSERLAGIGFFASGIAHEINNPLQAIANAAESLTGRLGDGSLGEQLPGDDRELLRTYLAMIERESTRCQQITSRVLDFARGTNGPKSRQDLTKIVTEVLDMVSHMSKFDGRKILFDRTQIHPADVSAAEMKQVVLNLVANGLEAMNGTGTMKIEIAELVDEVVLSVHDDGCGMTAAVIENLYEPFFTEKLHGKGTGLGLSITHRIVGDHGGRIEATSEGPGRGSTFLVHLPRCAKAAKSSAA